ncbi:COG4315 family predicted lipoprotein [Pseudoxanthomonas suwonensis]
MQMPVSRMLFAAPLPRCPAAPLLSVLALAACGYDAAPPEGNDGNTTGERGAAGAVARDAAGNASPSPEGDSRVVELAIEQEPAPHLVDASGASLYYLEGNVDGTKCDQACEGVWPPVLGTGTLQVADGAGGSDAVGTLQRADGTQVTWRGQPLYRYAGDQGARRSAGDGVVDEWGHWQLARP